MNKIVAIGNDHAGFALRKAVADMVRECGFEVLDLGTESETSVDYPDYGAAVANAVKDGRARFGIAICGSGIGISIAANRVAGVRAALCTDGLMAELSRRHNDANVLCLGARIIGDETAKECVRRFLATAFEAGRHTRRVEKLG